MEKTRPTTSSLSRRSWLRDAARWLGLGALSLVSGSLIWRALGRGAIGGSACDGCPGLVRCDLPEAVASRRRGLGVVTPVRMARPGAEVDVAASLRCAAGRRRFGQISAGADSKGPIV